MPDLAPELLVVLALASLIASTIDAIAGGGGLITIPTLLFAGFPPHLALGTNKLQSSVGTALAVYRYSAHNWLPWSHIRPALLTSFVGSAAGAYTLQHIQPQVLEPIIPFLVIGVALYFIFTRRLTDADSKPRLTILAFAASFSLVIGLYDGFFGPGTGSFFTAALIATLGYNSRSATAATKALNLVSNLAALGLFLYNHQVHFLAAAVMAATGALGGFIGSHLVLRHGTRIVRPLLIAVSLALALTLLVKHFT